MQLSYLFLRFLIILILENIMYAFKMYAWK